MADWQLWTLVVTVFAGVFLAGVACGAVWTMRMTRAPKNGDPSIYARGNWS